MSGHLLADQNNESNLLYGRLMVQYTIICLISIWRIYLARGCLLSIQNGGPGPACGHLPAPRGR
jgi:hypothetical protein